MESKELKRLVERIEECGKSTLAYENILYGELMNHYGFSYRTGRELIRMVMNEDLTDRELRFLFDTNTYKDINRMAEFTKAGLTGLIPEDMFMDDAFLEKAGTDRLPDHFIEGMKTPYKFTITKRINTVGIRAFYGCEELYEVKIEDGIENIGKEAFAETKIDKMILPDTVRYIGEGAFMNCWRLASVRLPKGYSHFGNDVFNGDGWLTDMNLPSVIYTGDRTFRCCTELEFPIGMVVKKLGKEAFYECEALGRVSLDTDTVPEKAFLGCRNLDTVIFKAVPHELSSEAFSLCRNISLSLFNGFRYETYGVKGITELMKNAGVIVKNVSSMEISSEKDIHKTLKDLRLQDRKK